MRITRSRAPEGRSKSRVIGVGKDKAQITCTLAVAGVGELLPYHSIFEGETNRSIITARLTLLSNILIQL